MQAETLASAYRLWRRNWKGRGKEYTAGALVWQVRASPAFIHPTRLPRQNLLTRASCARLSFQSANRC